jgi:primase-polymerase (primpol)-like protein
MSDLQTARPVAPAPNVDTIPAELIARVQLVCWWYEQDKNGKWTKPLIIPGTKSNASHSNKKHWRSFTEAYTAYMQSPTSAGGIYDGIGYVFSKDDPYVGGDIDNSLDMERVPLTCAEISPSGNGIKFIAKGTIAKGRKTAKGELYSKQRFFTITGNVLPGHETITECQEAVEAFAASLGTPKTLKNGTAGSGSRAELAAQIPEADWEAGRRLARNEDERRRLIDRRLPAAFRWRIAV